MTEDKKNMFNGKRDADKYVVGWIKVVTLILGTCSAVVVGTAGWGTLKLLELDSRVTVIESSRFTKEAGQKQQEQINENKRSSDLILHKLETIESQLTDFKELFKMVIRE